MPIKLIIFDLDGVLVDTRELHFHSLNQALEIHGFSPIPQDVHLSTYDGLPTSKKLQLLKIPEEKRSSVWKTKQDITSKLISTCIKPHEPLVKLLHYLKNELGLMVYVASNSIWTTIRDMLTASHILPLVDYFISNEEVKNPKPSPDIYMQCIMRAGVSVGEVLICEDSPIGRKSALSSGAHLCPISDVSDVTHQKIISYIQSINSSVVPFDLRWKRKLRIVIPMAGLGSRFVKGGYQLPKPLIDVMGKPMIQQVVENLNTDAEFIYLVQKSHYDTYNLGPNLKSITPRCHIIPLDEITEGAACTVLVAKSLINDDTPLLIANSDQYIEWDSNEFLYVASTSGIDGCVLTFTNDEQENKWSFVKLDENGFIQCLREKEPISNKATVGIYYWAKGSDFVKDAETMIQVNDRVNGEFYVAPVYNYGIARGLRFRTHNCKKMWGLGTPQDLEYFLGRHKVKDGMIIPQ